MTINGMLGFDWSAIIARLQVRDEWSREMEEKLSIIEAQMLITESEVRRREEELKQKTH